VNVGVIRAGSRTNVVCPEAEIHAEVRATTGDGMRRAADTIASLADRPPVPGTTGECLRLDWCPPMEDTADARQLLALYQSTARHLGLTVDAAATGGVGDANFLAGCGVPVLDGLGPVGGGDHSPQEWLDTRTVPTRVALLAATIARLGPQTKAPRH
jgi:glutamate carboxypeptidase